MSLPISRIAILAGATLLAACRVVPSEEAAANAAQTASPIEAVKGWVAGMSDERPRIYCAVGPGATLAQDCRLEIIEDATGKMLVLSRPDGGFRRLRVGPGDTLSAADGASEPRLARSGDVAGISFESERYAVPLSAFRPAAAR